MTFIATLGNWLERLIQPRNPDSADAWRERLIYIFLNLLIVTAVLAFLADAISSSLEPVRGLGGIAITVVVRLLAMRTPRVAGWFLVLAGALFVHFVLEPATLIGVAGGLTLGLLAVLGSAFIAPWAGLPVMFLVAWGLVPLNLSTAGMLVAVGGAVWILTALIETALQRYYDGVHALERANIELRAAQSGLEKRVQERTAELEKALIKAQSAEERSENLLRVILPAEVIEELKATRHIIPRRYDQVAVMFCDIVGFTAYCDAHSPEEVMHNLQEMVQHFEEIALRYRLQKIKTSGDTFMTTGGLFALVKNPVLNSAQCGLEMARVAPTLTPHWQVRVGIHFGPVIGGVVGTRQYVFDILGDTVNLAARVQEVAMPGTVYLSSEAWNHIKDRATSEYIPGLNVRGKGQMDMYRLREV